MSTIEPTFKQAINASMLWCNAWENEELSDEVLADRVAELLATRDGARGFFVIMLSIIIGIWWGVVHLIDIFFNALAWWQEPLTIFPVLFILIPYLGLTDRYGRNPLHWWPVVFGTTVEIPTVMSDPFNDELEEVLEDLGPMKVYMVDHETLKFRRKQDATMFCLQNL